MQPNQQANVMVITNQIITNQGLTSEAIQESATPDATGEVPGIALETWKQCLAQNYPAFICRSRRQRNFL